MQDYFLYFEENRDNNQEQVNILQIKFIDNANKITYNKIRRCVMAQTNINIRMDEDLKKQFDAFCSDIGMSMTTAFCVFAKTAVRERRIPFEISTEKDPFYGPNNMARLRESIAQMEATGGTIHEVQFDD